MRLAQSLQKKQRGQAIAELALILIVLPLFLLAVLELGKIFYIYNDLLTAARTGGRYLASHRYTTDPSYRSNAINLIVYGKTTVGPKDRPLLPDLATSNVQIEMPIPPGRSVPEFITVRIQYPIIPYSIPLSIFDLKVRPFDIYPEVTTRYLQPNG